MVCRAIAIVNTATLISVKKQSMPWAGAPLGKWLPGHIFKSKAEKIVQIGQTKFKILKALFMHSVNVPYCMMGDGEHLGVALSPTPCFLCFQHSCKSLINVDRKEILDWRFLNRTG